MRAVDLIGTGLLPAAFVAMLLQPAATAVREERSEPLPPAATGTSATDTGTLTPPEPRSAIRPAITLLAESMGYADEAPPTVTDAEALRRLATSADGASVRF